MKIALLSDVHANLRALEACLAHAAAQGAGRLAVLGDLVGYGAQPVEVVRRIRGLAGEGLLCSRATMTSAPWRRPSRPAHSTRAAPPGPTNSWTRDALDFLAALPLTATVDAALLVHASADAPERWFYVDNERRAEASLDAACLNPAVRYVFCGHVHAQTLYFRGAGQGLMRFQPTPGVPIPVPPHRRWIATVGSVGQPRDGNTRAMYALFDADRAELTFHRVVYDHLAAAADIRAAGLPAWFAERLEAGL